MPIGTALAQAKQRYLRESGIGAFGLYDEKALLVATLYGLPFVRATVPNPTARPSTPATFGIRTLQPAPDGIYTDTLTLRVGYTLTDLGTRGQIARLTSADIMDGPQGSSSIPLPEQRARSGRPTFPSFALPLDLGSRQIRGVSLRGATSDQIDEFNPTVTRLVTDHVYLEQEPPFDLGAAWYPGDIAAFSRFSASGGGSRSNLLVTPLQYRGNQDQGNLRIFREMTIDVYSIDPAQAPAPLREDTLAPYIRAVQQSRAPGGGVQVVVQATDNLGVVRVDLLAEQNGRWRSSELRPVGSDRWTGMVPGTEFIVSARDQAGNVGIYTGKGQWTAPLVDSLPLPLPYTGENYHPVEP
jgi:hypothetical protein